MKKSKSIVLDILLAPRVFKKLKVSQKTAELVARRAKMSQYSAYQIYRSAIEKYGDSEEAVLKYCSETFSNPTA